LGKRTFVAFFALALVFRLAIAAESGVFHRIGRTEMEGIAMNVAAFGNYALYYGPTAYSTPVYPLFLAGLFRLFGTGLLAHAVNVTLACAVSALRCGLVPLFAIDAGLGRGAAMLAGCIGVFYIAALDTEIVGGLDGPFVAIALLVLTWAVMRMWRDRSWQTRAPWWFFAFCGFSALLNPSLLPVMGGLLLAGAVACPAPARRRYLWQAALAVVGVLVFLAPWAIRNYRVLGAPILTRSNFGTEFWVSNGPGRTFDHPHNYGTYHPSQNSYEASQVYQLGEVAYNRVRFAEAREWVRAHPGQYLRFTAERVASWWFPPRPRIALAPKLVLTLLAFAGLWLMFRRQPLVAWLFLIAWVTFPDAYYLVQWSSRYRYPMDWQILLCASVALSAAWQAVVRPVVRPRHQARRDVPTAA
jgi:hypothetical protein